MHRVLHDWPDSQCRAILAPLKDAMARGYSKLLINENLIPNRGAKAGSTGLDLLMMSIQCGSERTETDWKVLLESVGFKTTKIWPVEEGSESLIEAELA